MGGANKWTVAHDSPVVCYKAVLVKWVQSGPAVRSAVHVIVRRRESWPGLTMRDEALAAPFKIANKAFFTNHIV